MNKEKIIGKIFKILYMREDVEKGILESSCLKAYISNYYIKFNSVENFPQEILDELKGMRKIIDELTHEEIRSSVFRMIRIIEKGSV